MTHRRKSFAGAGIGIIIFVLCYRLLPPPSGSGTGLKALWLLTCPVSACVAGGIIFGITGLIARSTKIFIGGLSSFIFLSSIIYVSCCLIFPEELRAFYTRFYIREEKAIKAEKRSKEIKEAIKENIKEQKTIPKPLIEKKPLKLVIKEEVTPEKDISKESAGKENKTIAVTKKIPKKDDGSGNPFDYGADELGGYIPIKGNHMLPDVSIKGILTLEDGESVAALRLKDKKRSFYVRKGNVIRIQDKKENKSMSEIYLQVREIKNNEVEIIQQQRPDKVIIIR
jgi:hypothetical protein